MNIKTLVEVVIFILLLSGVYFYFIQKSRKCENKECKCPIDDNLREGRLIIGAMSFFALCSLALIEIFIK